MILCKNEKKIKGSTKRSKVPRKTTGEGQKSEGGKGTNGKNYDQSLEIPPAGFIQMESKHEIDLE